MLFHDNEPHGLNRSDTAGQGDPRKSADLTSIGTCRTRFDLFLTFISQGGSTGERAKLPENPASKSSDVSSRVSRLPRAWDSKVNFANGRTCSGLEIDHALH